MKGQKDCKVVANLAFFAMLSLMTLLCLFLYFGDENMSCCEKICISIIIFVIAIFACICLWKLDFKKQNICGNQIYVEDVGIYVLYKGKHKPNICQIKYYDSVKDLKENNSETTRIYIKSGENIVQDIFDLLKDKGYEFSVENSDSTIVIKSQNKKSNAGNTKAQHQENNQNE